VEENPSLKLKDITIVSLFYLLHHDLEIAIKKGLELGRISLVNFSINNFY